jgi:hypothetical protein
MDAHEKELKAARRFADCLRRRQIPMFEVYGRLASWVRFTFGHLTIGEQNALLDQVMELPPDS